MDQPQTSDRPDDVTAAEGPPLTPLEWLRANGLFLAVMAGIVGLIYWNYGLFGVWKSCLVVLGVGLVIFVHEMGHFLAAKWCDVHVATFSLGFGPALPGCSFRYGETVYKIAAFPVGGYVSMVGQDDGEGDDDEDDPRSFKHKTVYQRMLIMSAGVVMNVVLGCVCFIVVYRFNGERRAPAVVSRVEPGSPAWRAGVRSGMTITHIGRVANPWWDDLTTAVRASSAGERIPFEFRRHDGETVNLELMPRSEKSDDAPVIGVLMPYQLKLPKKPRTMRGTLQIEPYNLDSAAAAARTIDLREGDVLLSATDPEAVDNMKALPADQTAALTELAGRMTPLIGKPLVVKVRRAGAEIDVPAAEKGFEFEDAIIGMSDPAAGADVLHVTELPPAPYEPYGPPAVDRDYFVYYDRLLRLIGRPIVIEVDRVGADKPVKVLTPPAYHNTIGVRMKMGEVAAVRDGSPALKAGVRKDDVLTKVVVKTAAKEKTFVVDQTDPLRLPDLLAEAAKPGPAQVTLTVLRRDEKTSELILPAVEWDPTWDDAEESAGTVAAPLAVPQLGLAYRVESRVAAVDPGGPAARAGLRKDDLVVQIRFRKPVERAGDKPKWNDWLDMKSKSPRGPDAETYEQWAHIAYVLDVSYGRPVIQMQVRRDGKVIVLPGETDKPSDDGPVLTAEEDPSWPMADRGLLLQPDYRVQKADTLPMAVRYGVSRTGDFLRQTYLGIRGMLTGRLSTNNASGAAGIAALAFEAAEDPFFLALVLGIISINLAVVNFLPIPALDGGHMVFLIYEWVRGRPPSDAIRNNATVAGWVLLITLIVLVNFNDLRKIFHLF